MSNKFNKVFSSKILEQQEAYFDEKVKERLNDIISDQEADEVINDILLEKENKIGGSLLEVRKAESGHLPYVEELIDMNGEIVKDLDILNLEVKNIGEYLSDYFNYAQTEKARLENRTKSISGLATDLNLISNDIDENSIYFKDSFDDNSKIDLDFSVGTAAQISTIEGVVTLKRAVTNNLSTNAKISSIRGNGSEGTSHLARHAKQLNREGKEENSFYYVSEQSPNNDSMALLDGRPDTVFEYQNVNFDTAATKSIHKNYNLDFVKSKQTGDNLRVQIIVDLKENKEINWINVNPYNPANSTGKVKVYSISTSEDGIDFKPLYDTGTVVLNSEINTTPQSYRADAIFDGNNDFTESKFSGQGVWTFPTRKARFVEVVLDQDESYPELIGHTYYEKITKDSNGVEQKRVRIKENEVEISITDSKIGEYVVEKELSIYKGIEGFEGWRYAIGLRDINIMAYSFEDKSEFVSKKYETESPIKKIMLYANEKIPTSYLDKISTSNDWIKYYLTFDDVNWVEISPQHHEPLNDSFAPKIIEINMNEIETYNAFNLYKESIKFDEDVYWVRLKVVLSRPNSTEEIDYSTSTPVLEDYALRIIKG